MKKIYLMMSLFIGALLMVSCGSKSSSDKDDEDNSDLTAEESVVKFLEANRDGDVDVAYSFVDHDRYDREDAEEDMNRHGGIKRFEIVEAEEEGTRAKVVAKIKCNDGESRTLTFRMNKRSKGWVIVN